MVAGDLNGDRDHAAVRDLLDAGLRDAHDERGRGLARTWPAAFPLLHLDHVLVRDGGGAQVAVRSVREVRRPRQRPPGGGGGPGGRQAVTEVCRSHSSWKRVIEPRDSTDCG